MNKLTAALAAFAALAALTGAAKAATTADEAAKLKSTLTPLGAEKAGNADGSIPAWDGGLKDLPVSGAMGDIPTAIFPGEKPLFQVTAANMAQYEALLSDGTRALLRKFPDTFRLDVYPTHRTARASDTVYERTFANATGCETTDGGLSLKGCIGGTPFPIPSSGIEVMWNFLMRIEAPSIDYSFKNIVGNADGTHTLATRNQISFQYPFYYPEATAGSFKGEYAMLRFNTLEPPFKAGESLVIRDSIDPADPRKAWQYLVGQRRVRRAPTVAYDTPDFVASGANYFDEVQGLFGALDRYTWKLVGKKELLIPYNSNGFIGASQADAFAKHHLNPDKVRWERHRVWVVEATVADGKRHAVPKRTYYLDEDTWLIALMDGYDAEGKLWRTTQMTPFVVPAIPATIVKTATVFNLQANTMSVIQALNGETFKVVPQKPETFFTGDAVAADGMR
ncbi:DUF1329 domain-containing protein [Zavarzinia compransoris]|uniref:DUF1329 domain-containing protein n=1 Tax=Zavarzinia compransoris TaxID=1264899 RepID=A0A317E8G2_9PROT|nr:DUF1329 domain-containing protein [Zavarzinia compransoris]PWR23169.1 DUF1329 domain-containing protein [Zavarzinia compransoris]TDP46273.1 uncharacterized protein DUF1329 [Zavarzinia compransoris]